MANPKIKLGIAMGAWPESLGLFGHFRFLLTLRPNNFITRKIRFLFMFR